MSDSPMHNKATAVPASRPCYLQCTGMFGASEPSRTSFSHASDSSLPSDASGFAQYAKRHVQHQQSRQAPLAASDSFEGFGQRTSTRTPSAGESTLTLPNYLTN